MITKSYVSRFGASSWRQAAIRDSTVTPCARFRRPRPERGAGHHRAEPVEQLLRLRRGGLEPLVRLRDACEEVAETVVLGVQPPADDPNRRADRTHAPILPEVGRPSVEDRDPAAAAVDAQAVAGLDPPRARAGANHCRQSVLARDDRGVAQGLPPEVSWRRVSSLRVGSSSSRSLSRWWSAPRLNGRSVSCSIRPSSNALPSSSGAASPGPSATLRGPDALVPKTAEGDLEHPCSGRVEPLDVVECDHDGAALGQQPEHVEHGQSDRARVGRRLVRLGEEQSDLDGMPTERGERRASSANTSARRSERPAKESEASASAPRQERT